VTDQSAMDSIAAVFAEERGRLLAALAARFGDLDLAEEVVQESMEVALARWPVDGVPRSPAAWLLTTARRRAVDRVRRDRTYTERLALLAVEADRLGPVAEPEPGDDLPDERLKLFFTCCHPALSLEAQIALTLRFLAGLSTAEVAAAFLVPVPTMQQRIVRAKRKIVQARIPFRVPQADELSTRLPAVLRVAYLVFTEAYASTEGQRLMRTDLAEEAIRLARILLRLLPDQREVTGLLALLLLTDARRAARTGPDGELIPLAEQDRNLWDRGAIAEGIGLVSGALSNGSIGSYQLQAAIAAVHDEAARSEDTDWPQILALYGLFARMADNPMVALTQAIAAAMVHGPATGLDLLKRLEGDERLAGHYRLDAVRAHLLERAGDRDAAIVHYRAAAGKTTSIPERDYLLAQAARLAAPGA